MGRLKFVYAGAHADAEPGELYKLPGDAKSYLRVCDPVPKTAKVELNDVSVAGTSRRGYAREIMKWITDKGRGIYLEQDHRNKYDATAVRVMGISRGLFGRRKAQLGWIPAEQSSEVWQLMVEGSPHVWVKTFFAPVEGRDVGLRLKIGRVIG